LDTGPTPFSGEKTPHFTIKMLSLLMLLKEIIAVYSDNYKKSFNSKYSVTDDAYNFTRVKGLR
jgi:hypothetical protein